MPKNNTAKKIIAAGRRLLDSEGSDAVTMRRIAQAVGITAMAIYRHYSDREALLKALADEGFRELAACLARSRSSGSVEDRLMRLADIFLEHALENPRLFELMFLKPRPGARRFPEDFESGESPTANFIAEVVRQGMQEGYFREDDVWEIVFETGALSHGLIMLFLGGRMGMSAARFRKLYRRSFGRYIRGIRK
jgi:AcrR family transcriptional regulator